MGASGPILVRPVNKAAYMTTSRDALSRLRRVSPRWLNIIVEYEVRRSAPKVLPHSLKMEGCLDNALLCTQSRPLQESMPPIESWNIGAVPG